MPDLRESLSANFDKLAGDTAETAGGAAGLVDTGAAQADIGDKAQPVAGDGTKATPSNVASEKAGKAGARPILSAAAPPQERAKPPSSWAAEYHDHFGKLDPRLQEYIRQREKEASDGLSQYGDKLKKLEPLGALEPMLAPWRQTWSRYGLSDQQGLGRMFETYSEYLNNPKQFIERQAQQLGIRLQQQEEEQAEQYDSQEPLRPERIQQLVDERTRQALEPITRQFQEQRNREFVAQVTAYANEKDPATGNPLRPYFESVRGDIMGWFQSILQGDPSLSFRDALDRAYSKATWGNDEVRQKLIADEQAKSQAAREQEIRERDQKGRFVKAEGASKSAVRSEPPEPEDGPGTRKKKDVRSSLSAAYDRLSAGRASI